MFRFWLVLATLALGSEASAATLSFERDEPAASCAPDLVLEHQVEARLGRALGSLPDSQAVRVTLGRHGSSWLIRIEMRDQTGALRGERRLRVVADDCKKVEPYVTLALALMIDPNAAMDLFSETAAPEASAPPETPSPPEPPGPQHPTPPAESPPSIALAALPAPSAPSARTLGEGHSVVYVYPAALPTEGPRTWPTSLPREAIARRIQSVLGERLLKREVYTVVEPAAIPALKSDAAGLARKSARHKSPPLEIDGKPAPPADFVLIPCIEELAVQDGVDYSLGSKSSMIAVSLRVHLFVVDVKSRRELGGFDVKTGFSLAGSSRDPKAAHFAAQLAIEKAVEEVLDALRVESAFRIRPRFVEHPDSLAELASLRGVTDGDRFEFEAADGTRSGYATVYDVGADRAAVRVWKSGQGRLLALGRALPLVPSVWIRNVHRVAYAAPSASEVSRAAQAGLSARHFGAGTELGMMWRVQVESANGTRIRPFLEAGWSFIGVHNLALAGEARAGLGYEVSLVKAIGLSFLPYASVGALLVRGRLGDDHSTDKLDGLLGLSGNLGACFEFYRLLGNLSLAASAEADYVLPLVSASAREDFIDQTYPALHALSFQLGVVYRPSEFPN